MRSRAERSARFWQRLDSRSHRPLAKRVLPRRFRLWVCERFDRSLGMDDDDFALNDLQGPPPSM